MTRRTRGCPRNAASDRRARSNGRRRRTTRARALRVGNRVDIYSIYLYIFIPVVVTHRTTQSSHASHSIHQSTRGDDDGLIVIVIVIVIAWHFVRYVGGDRADV